MSEQKRIFSEIENKNRRIFKRTEIKIDVRYQTVKYQNWYTTVTRGLGADGICLITSEYLGVGTIIKIQLFLPRLVPLLDISGEILWSDFIFRQKHYESGIKFISLTNNARDFISRYVEKYHFSSLDAIIPFKND